MSEQEILQSLHKAIEQDRNYFVKAKIDKNLDSIRSQVDGLLGEIQQEAKTKAEKEILKVEPMAKRMEEWFRFNREFSDKDARSKYLSAWNKIQGATRNYKRHSYFDYLEALKIIKGVRDNLEYVQESIRYDLNYSKRRLRECNTKVERYGRDIRNIDRIGHFSLIALSSGIVMWVIGEMLANNGYITLFSLLFLVFLIGLVVYKPNMHEWWGDGGLGILVELMAVFFLMLIMIGEIPVFSGLLVLLGPHIIMVSLTYYFGKKPSYDPKIKQNESGKEIESLKQRILVAKKSVGILLTEEERLEDLFEALPDELKEALVDENLFEKIVLVGKEFRISEEAIEELAAICGEVFLGTLPLSNLARELEEKLDLTPEIAQNLAHELDSEIFSEFKGSLGGMND